jgi:hypothetical protein
MVSEKRWFAKCKDVVAALIKEQVMFKSTYLFKNIERYTKLLNDNAHIESGEKRNPDIIRFENNREAFIFACGTCKTDYFPGDILLGFVEAIDESTVTKEKVAIYRLKVQSPNGGKVIPSAISAVNVPILKHEDLIIFKVHSDNTESNSEELIGMVGVITARVDPELHLLDGWKIRN